MVPFAFKVSSTTRVQSIQLTTTIPQADDEMENPYLKGFEWDKDESWTRLIVHQQKDAGPSASSGGSKKKGKKNKDEE